MNEFIALPVAQGDSFYLKRDGWSVLVDGGRNAGALPGLFTTHAGTNAVEVLVCTHNDADHANGVLGFLRAGLHAQEVWLPGRWLDSLSGVLQPPESLVMQLVHEVRSASIRDVASRLADPLESFVLNSPDAGELRPVKDRSIEIGDDGWPATALDQLERSSAHGWDESRILWPFDPFFGYYRILNGLDQDQHNLLWSAIDAAKRIRDIATEAFHRGVKVRWFDFAPRAPSGGTLQLQPINCREVLRIRPSGNVSLLMYLALSVANKESLVFYSPGPENAGGVLFTADSDLSGVVLTQPLKNALVTSPHHGSDANLAAYSVVQSGAGADRISLTWIRSDGRYRSRPGKGYLGIAEPRYCTICQVSSGVFSTKHSAGFHYSTSGWARTHSTISCKCS